MVLVLCICEWGNYYQYCKCHSFISLWIITSKNDDNLLPKTRMIQTRLYEVPNIDIEINQTWDYLKIAAHSSCYLLAIFGSMIIRTIVVVLYISVHYSKPPPIRIIVSSTFKTLNFGFIRLLGVSSTLKTL